MIYILVSSRPTNISEVRHAPVLARKLHHIQYLADSICTQWCGRKYLWPKETFINLSLIWYGLSLGCGTFVECVCACGCFIFFSYLKYECDGNHCATIYFWNIYLFINSCSPGDGMILRANLVRNCLCLQYSFCTHMSDFLCRKWKCRILENDINILTPRNLQ